MADVKIEKTVGLPAKIVAEVASDSDDDLPITTMIKKREREEKAYREAAERERKAVKSNTKSESAIKSKSSSSETKKSENKNEGGGGGGGGFTFYENTDKGRLIHAFLIRWWYAYDWPTPEEIGQPPAGFESLDGFPGVFVSTRVSLYLY